MCITTSKAYLTSHPGLRLVSFTSPLLSLMFSFALCESIPIAHGCVLLSERVNPDSAVGRTFVSPFLLPPIPKRTRRNGDGQEFSLGDQAAGTFSSHFLPLESMTAAVFHVFTDSTNVPGVFPSSHHEFTFWAYSFPVASRAERGVRDQ